MLRILCALHDIAARFCDARGMYGSQVRFARGRLAISPRSLCTTGTLRLKR